MNTVDLPERIIWQYWETRGAKPNFVDGLREIAVKNAGIDIVLVTPDNLEHYLPDLPTELLAIEELAHKADMIRAMLIARYGGMWLDSDAIVLTNLNWLFDLLDQHEFVGFNDDGQFSANGMNVRINCFVARQGSSIMQQWVKAQHAKFPRTEYQWTEVGTDLLDPIIWQHQDKVKLLPFDLVCPIRWDQVSRFSSKWENAHKVLEKTNIVMLSNKSLHQRNPNLTQMSVEELAQGTTLIADIMRRAIDSQFVPQPRWKKLVSAITSRYK